VPNRLLRRENTKWTFINEMEASSRMKSSNLLLLPFQKICKVADVRNLGLNGEGELLSQGSACNLVYLSNFNGSVWSFKVNVL